MNTQLTFQAGGLYGVHNAGVCEAEQVSRMAYS